MQQEVGLTSSGQLFLLYTPKAQKQLYQISATVHPHSALTPLECFVVVVFPGFLRAFVGIAMHTL